MDNNGNLGEVEIHVIAAEPEQPVVSDDCFLLHLIVCMQ